MLLTLVAHAPEAAANIKFVRLAYLEHLLQDTTKPLPRCQDLPETAFGSLVAGCLLLAVSHGWFFQCHPDPFGDKMVALRGMLSNLRQQYPVVEILVFFDFLSITQRPYKSGQGHRTTEEQALFIQVLGQMHFCYVYADVVIHLHSDPPVEDTDTYEITIDMSKVEIAQTGKVIQVVSFNQDVQCKFKAFDIISTIDGKLTSSLKHVPNEVARVCYHKRPYGNINPIPVQERGWMYLERFITML